MGLFQASVLLSILATSALADPFYDIPKLHASQAVIGQTSISLYDLYDESEQGMHWSVQNSADLGIALDAARKAVKALHEQFPSAVADAYGNGTLTNIEDTIKLFGSGNLERGCVSHQHTIYNAVKPKLDGSSLKVRKLFVLRKLFAHNVVIVYPVGADWKKSGIILDPWLRQKSDLDKMVYRFNLWYGPLDFKARLIDEDKAP